MRLRDVGLGVALMVAVVVVAVVALLAVAVVLPCSEWCEPGSGGRTVCTCR